MSENVTLLSSYFMDSLAGYNVLSIMFLVLLKVLFSFLLSSSFALEKSSVSLILDFLYKEIFFL